GGNLCSGSSLQSISDSTGIRPVDCGELGCHIFDSSIWLAWAYVNHGQLHVIARSLLKGLSKGSIIHIGDCAGRDHQYAHRAINISGAVSCGIGRCDNRWARLWLAARAKCLDGVGGFVTVAKAQVVAVSHGHARSGEHTSELQSRHDLYSLPTRRSSDLSILVTVPVVPTSTRTGPLISAARSAAVSAAAIIAGRDCGSPPVPNALMVSAASSPLPKPRLSRYPTVTPGFRGEE